MFSQDLLREAKREIETITLTHCIFIGTDGAGDPVEFKHPLGVVVRPGDTLNVDWTNRGYVADAAERCARHGYWHCSDCK